MKKPLKTVQLHITAKLFQTEQLPVTVTLFKNKNNRRKSVQQFLGMEGTTQVKVVMAVSMQAWKQWRMSSSVEKHEYTKKLKCNSQPTAS